MPSSVSLVRFSPFFNQPLPISVFSHTFLSSYPCPLTYLPPSPPPLSPPCHQANPSLFPCTLSSETEEMVAAAVEAAVAEWGANSLPVLEAEARLAYACEKVRHSFVSL